MIYVVRHWSRVCPVCLNGEGSRTSLSRAPLAMLQAETDIGLACLY